MGLLAAIGQLRGDRVAVEREGVHIREIPAVKHKIARILVGLDGLFAVDVGADEALEIVDVLLRGVLADDGRGLAQPEVVILAVEDDGEQIRIGRAVFSGNVGQDTEIGGRFCFFPGLRLSGFFGLFRGLRRGGLGVRGRGGRLGVRRRGRRAGGQAQQQAKAQQQGDQAFRVLQSDGLLFHLHFSSSALTIAESKS